MTPTGATPADIVGREAELEAVAGLIDDAGDGPRALLLEGDAGIGKTTLWRWGVDRAGERGHAVLCCRPAESEDTLPFAALGDLFEPVLNDVLPLLPPPQRTAFETALARIEPVETLGRLAVARAGLAAIKELAVQTSLVLAIDDAQWLDRPTADVLEFAARRLETFSVRILVASRRESDIVPLALDSVPPERLTRIWLEPFSVAELDGLLHAQLGQNLERPRLVELHRITDGNPFYALEIARAAARRNSGVTEEFVVPESLSELLRDRLRALSADAQKAILLAAASQQPDAAIVQKAAGGSEGLAEAVRDGMIEVVGERLAFAHPLLSSVAYNSALPLARLDAHQLLADVCDDPLERGRHLALATEVPEDGIAAELDLAALRAHRLGAPAVAADLAGHACRLTSEGRNEDVLIRTARSSEYHLAAGDTTRGRELLERVVDARSPGHARAELLLRLGRVRLLTDQLAAAQEVFQQALAEAGDDARLAAEIEQALAFTVIGDGDIPRAHRHACSALSLAEQVGDQGLLALSLSRVVLTEFLLGMGFDHDRMEQAVQLEGRIGGEAALEWMPSYVHAFIALCVDELELARTICARLHRTSLEHGDERNVANILIPMSMIERAAGNWVLASRYANEAVERSRQSGLATLQAGALSAQALVSAMLGEESRARAAADEGLAIAGRIGAVPWIVWITGALGHLELSLGDPAATHIRLGQLSDMAFALGLGEPGVVRFLPDEIEALVALDELDSARRLTTMLEEQGAALDRTWAVATGARSAALVAAADGDFDRARDALARAFTANERLAQPFELARTLLVEGMIERRAKQRSVARDALTRALDIFDSLGAPLWAEKAAAELARIPGRAPAAAGELSPTERRVAELAAAGLSNKEVAGQLYVTVRTVEWNLSKVYAKLGVRSRTELARQLGDKGHS